jgi:DNA-directed RNA polymerase specialized sigma24 family protein
MNGTDGENLTRFYRDVFPDAARLVKRMGGGLEDAKDIFHDAILIYLEKKAAGTLRVNTSHKAYVLGTVRILWLHAAGKDCKELPQEIEDFISEAEPAEEREADLLSQLERTGMRCLQLLKAFYYDNLALNDIAKRFGYNGVRSATVQKHKCIEKLRSQIQNSSIYETGTY